MSDKKMIGFHATSELNERIEKVAAEMGRSKAAHIRFVMKKDCERVEAKQKKAKQEPALN